MFRGASIHKDTEVIEKCLEGVPTCVSATRDKGQQGSQKVMSRGANIREDTMTAQQRRGAKLN